MDTPTPTSPRTTRRRRLAGLFALVAITALAVIAIAVQLRDGTYTLTAPGYPNETYTTPDGLTLTDALGQEWSYIAPPVDEYLCWNGSFYLHLKFDGTNQTGVFTRTADC